MDRRQRPSIPSSAGQKRVFFRPPTAREMTCIMLHLLKQHLSLVSRLNTLLIKNGLRHPTGTPLFFPSSLPGPTGARESDRVDCGSPPGFLIIPGRSGKSPSVETIWERHSG